MIKKDSKSEYAEAEGLNYSSLKFGIDKSLMHMQHKIKEGYIDSGTKGKSLGTLLHSLILEPVDFAKKLVVWKGGFTAKDEPTMSKNSTAYKEFAKENDKNYIVEPEKYALIDEIKTAVYCNPEAREILENSEKEVSAYWNDDQYGTGKARFDILQRTESINKVWDIKTCADISKFLRQFFQYGYHYQSGWYSNAAQVCFSKNATYGVIIVETEPPFEVAVLPVNKMLIERGYQLTRRIAIEYREAQKTGKFPGHLADLEEIQMPEWMMDDEVII